MPFLPAMVAAENPTDPVLAPNSSVLGALLWLLLVLALGHVGRQGLPLHLRQQALLDQRRFLEARIAVHLHQLIDLAGLERNAKR